MSLSAINKAMAVPKIDGGTKPHEIVMMLPTQTALATFHLKNLLQMLDAPEDDKMYKDPAALKVLQERIAEMCARVINQNRFQIECMLRVVQCLRRDRGLLTDDQVAKVDTAAQEAKASIGTVTDNIVIPVAPSITKIRPLRQAFMQSIAENMDA